MYIEIKLFCFPLGGAGGADVENKKFFLRKIVWYMFISKNWQFGFGLLVVTPPPPFKISFSWMSGKYAKVYYRPSSQQRRMHRPSPRDTQRRSPRGTLPPLYLVYAPPQPLRLDIRHLLGIPSCKPCPTYPCPLLVSLSKKNSIKNAWKFVFNDFDLFLDDCYLVCFDQL